MYIHTYIHLHSALASSVCFYNLLIKMRIDEQLCMFKARVHTCVFKARVHTCVCVCVSVLRPGKDAKR